MWHAGEVACIIIDELHMVSDPSRGNVLEVCLTKLLASPEASAIQIIGMSATMAGGQRALSLGLDMLHTCCLHDP